MSGSFFVSLRSKVQNLLSPWLLSESLFQRVRNPSAKKNLHYECEVLPSDPEWDFVNSYFFQYAPLTYSIKRIFCIHNPPQTEQFEASLLMMDGETQNPVFSPKWQTEDPTGCRAKVMTRWRESAAAFSPVAVVRAGTCKRKEVLSHVFVFPYWHGSSQQKVQSICDTGFAYFGKHSYLQETGTGSTDTGSTDIGFFGSGIYFTNSARYAADIYSSGHLLLAWVSIRSPYPVIGEEEAADKPSDIEKLQARYAFENYDAHYIPVIVVDTSNPMCKGYVPCRKDQIPMWDEAVVFHKSQTLPRFYVELMVTLPTTLVSPVAMLTQLLENLQQISNKPEIADNPQLLSLFQQKKQLLFVMGNSSVLSSVGQKFFDLVRQLQTGAAKLNDCAIRQFLAFAPSPLPAPATTPSLEPPATFSPPPSTFLPSPFDIPPVLERSVPNEEILEASGIKKEEALASLNPLFRRILAWQWIHDPGEEWKIPCLDFDRSTSVVSSSTAPYQLSDGRKLVISNGSIFLEERRGVFQCVVPNMDPEPLLFLKEGLVLVKKYGNFQVVNPKNGEVLNTFSCYRAEWYEKLISAPNSKLVAVSDDRIDIWDRKCDRIIKSLHLKEDLGPFWLSENVRFLARRFGESFQVFLEKSAVLKASFYYKVVELQNGGIVGVSEDRFLKVWDTKGICLRVLKGHEKKISFAIELHGNRLISGSEDGVLKIWDLQSGDVLCTWKGHESEITAICELKDGLIASGDQRGVKVWSPKGEPLYGFRILSHVSILSLKDGRFVTLSGREYSIRNPKDGKCEQVVETQLVGTFDSGFFYLAQREDGNLSIFRVSKDKPIYRVRKDKPYECTVFDLRTGKALGRPLIAQKSFRISKEKMVSFFKGRVFLWDLASGKCIRQMQSPSDRVKDCILLQDGSLLIGFTDGTLQKWEQSSCVKTWNRKRITTLLQLRDGRIVIGSDLTKSHFTLEVWSPDVEECLSTWDGYNGGSLLQLEDGSLIEEHHKGVGWNVTTGQPICPSVDLEWIRYKRKIQNFECFCGSNWDQGFCKMLDLSQESDLQWILENEVHQLQVGIDLRKGFLVYENSCLQILDPKTNTLLRPFARSSAVFLLKNGSLATTESFSFEDYWTNLPGKKVKIYICNPHTLKDSRIVNFTRPDVLGEEPSTITWFRALEKSVPNWASSSILKIWNSLSETCKASFRYSELFPIIQLEAGAFAFSYLGAVEIWNKEATRRLEILGGDFFSHNKLLLLQDGSILNWVTKNPTIRIWNPADGKMVQVLHGHLDSITCAIQLREGPVVSGSEDSTLKVWDLKGGNCLQTLQSHRGTITSLLQLSENRLLSGAEDGTLKVWNLVTGECLKTIRTKGPVLSLFQLQDGRILSRSKKDDRYNFLQLWDLKRGVPIRSLIVQRDKDLFDQIRFQDEVLGKEKIHLDLWHPFLMPLPFPDLFSSLSPFLNRLEEQVKEEILKRELPLGTQYKCQWTQKLLQNPVRLKCGHIFEAVAFEKQECPLCKNPIQGGVCIDLKLQETLAAAIKKYSIPKMAVASVVEVPDKVSALQSQARLHVERKELTQALDRYSEALQFTNRSSAYIPIAQILKEHFPRQAPLALLHLAKVQAKEEDLFGMQETLRSLSDLLKYPELFELLGECALLSKEPTKARTFYEKAMEQYEVRGQKEDIIRGYEKILACDFSNFPLYERLLKLYEEKEKKIALCYMGIFHFRKKDPEKAKALVEQAEKLDPGNPLFSLIYNHVDPF